MSWSRDGCARCDRGEHDKCTGYATFIDQDGTNSYFCGCFCQSNAKYEREMQDVERKLQGSCDEARQRLGTDRFERFIRGLLPAEVQGQVSDG